MQYTERQVREFQRQFAERRTRQWLATLPVIAATILIIVSDRLNKSVLGIPPVVVTIVAFGVILGFIVFTLVNWRCPACNSYLGKRINPRFCSSCGVALDGGTSALEPKVLP